MLQTVTMALQLHEAFPPHKWQQQKRPSTALPMKLCAALQRQGMSKSARTMRPKAADGALLNGDQHRVLARQPPHQGTIQRLAEPAVQVEEL